MEYRIVTTSSMYSTIHSYYIDDKKVSKEIFSKKVPNLEKWIEEQDDLVFKFGISELDDAIVIE